MADLETNTNFDAEQMIEEIETGEQKAPQVNVEADYERSKQYEVADIDHTQEGAQAAKAATAHNVKPSNFGEVELSTPESDSDPEAFRSMAKDVNPRLQS